MVEIKETISTTYSQIEEGGWIMAAKKGKTKGQKAKKDFIDFIEDATGGRSTVGVRFLNKLNEKDAKEDDLYRELKSLGYGGVSKPFFSKILKIYGTSNKLKKVAGETGY